MARAKREGKVKRKRRAFRWLLFGAGIACVAYAVARRQKPGPCVPAGGPDERVMIKDEENISGLGSIMASLITQLLEDPRKVAALNDINLIVAIEPTEQPETAITMSFSDGYVVLEPGVAPGADIKIICDYGVLMQMAGMPPGLAALKFLASPDGQELARKFLIREVQIRGLAAHPVGMMKFTRFLASSGDGAP